jgi:outer membrane lipoprotein LolB
LVFLLIGCSTKVVKPPTQAKAPDQYSWQMQQLRLQNLTKWQAEGRLAAKSGEEGGQAHFTWIMTPQSYQIDVFGPFGAGHIKINGNDKNVRLTDGKNHNYSAPTPEALFHDVAGWSIPISGMHYWMKGIPDPSHPIENKMFDIDGRLTRLNQNGWEITYKEYQGHPLTPLPTKIIFKNNDTKVKIIVQSWHRYA